MSEKYKIFPGGMYFVTITTVGWIDVFTRSVYCDELIKNLNYCIANKGLRVFAFCIMPSHLHMVASVDNGNLSDVLRDFKSYTGKQLIKMIEENIQESRKEWLLYMFEFYGKKNKHNAKYQFWQHNNHAFDLFANKLIDHKVDYIHNNPVEACMVMQPGDYVYSSANLFTALKLSQL